MEIFLSTSHHFINTECIRITLRKYKTIEVGDVKRSEETLLTLGEFANS